MPPADLPKDYAWTWERGTLRVTLPPIVETQHHVFEPVLSRADARRLVAAIWDHATNDGRSGPLRAPTRVDLVHDRRFGADALTSFRDRVIAEMTDRTLRADVVLVPEGAAAEVAPLALEAPPDVPMLEAPPDVPILEASSEAPTLPPEPSLPAGFDAGSDTDMGLDDDLEFGDSPAASEPPPEERPAAGETPPSERRLERPSRQGSTPSWRRRFEKKKKRT
jgi:hypothetical protein